MSVKVPPVDAPDKDLLDYYEEHATTGLTSKHMKRMEAARRKLDRLAREIVPKRASPVVLLHQHHHRGDPQAGRRGCGSQL